MEPDLEVSATCQGISPAFATVPPTIFEEFPLLVKSSLLRDPEQALHLPLWAVPQVALALANFEQQADVNEIWKDCTSTKD